MALIMLPAVSDAQPASGQPGRMDVDAIAKQTGVWGILFEAANGFQLFQPDRRLKANIRLDVGDPQFLAKYLVESPLAPAIDSASALQIARGLVQQAIQHRHKGELQAAYLLYRFALANLARSDDVTGLDIVTHNVWALRGAGRVRDERQAGAPKAVLDLVRGDAVVLQRLLSADPNYTSGAIEQDTSLRRLRILRRVADLADQPTGFAAHAQRALAAGAGKPIPIGWIAPAAEELASRDLITVLTAEGQITGDTAGLAKTWELYQALRPRVHEVANVGELSFILDLAKHNYRRMRSQAVAAGGTFGHSISMFAISKYLQAFGRDLATLTWRRGSREQALELAEGMQSRALTDWLARSHASNRLLVQPDISGSVGEVRPASLAEIRSLAQRSQTPILYYFKAADGYFLWAILPDGKIETAELSISRADLADILQIFPYGSEASPVASTARAATRSEGDGDPAQTDLATKQGVLAALRRKVIPDQVMQRLQGHGRLHIVPDGLVNYVPFAALVGTDGKYLIDAYMLHYSPAVTTALVLESSFEVRKAKRGAPGETAIALPSQTDERLIEITIGGEKRSFVFEPLAGATEETQLVADLLKGKVSTALPARSRSYLPVLHFATHGFFDVERPLASFLILEKGKLTAEQLYFGQMHVETGLVVMSACQTGLGFTHPDSLIGLRNGFLVAGAQSVLGTFWMISDAGTLALMNAFYRSLAGGKPIDGALREAQLALKGNPEFADPYYWGAFHLVGLANNPF